MGVETKQIWTCDHCGKEITMEPGEHPEGWFVVDLKQVVYTKYHKIIVHKYLCSGKCICQSIIDLGI